MKSSKYREAGVDIEVGDNLIERIKPLADATAVRGVMGGVGDFGGLFSLKKAGFKDPVLVAGTDGVGTKLKVAQMMNIHNTIGIDLVAMCVNDIITTGAKPIFFLDYYATGKLNIKTAEAVIKGIAKGCQEAGCVLLGGETAEMPGFYAEGEYDLAGFAVGAVERKEIIDGKALREGDILIGLASSGIHSNGYSLARKVFFEKMRLSPHDKVRGLKQEIGKELLKPTRIYVSALMKLKHYHRITGVAHITGGGITGNVPRMIKREGLCAFIDRKRWKPQKIFEIIADVGNVEREEMFQVFNMGIGLVIAVPRKEAESAAEKLKSFGEKPILLGEIIAGKNKEVIYNG